MGLRAKLLAQDCQFEAVVTADYGDKVYTFTMVCRTEDDGGLTFTVLEPESIAGITGEIREESGKLTFGDDQALAFDTLAEGQVTPVTAPWLLIKTLRGGYLTSCGTEDELLRVTIDDSYADDALTLDIWLDSLDQPVAADILWQGRRMLSIQVRSFAFV